MRITVPADSSGESARSFSRAARRTWCAAALGVVQLLVLPSVAVAAEPRTWIVGATVISPERADDGRKLNVLIEGDRIAAVSDELPPKASQDASIVDAAGSYLIPGLIDSHVHLQTVPGFTPLMNLRHPLLVWDYRAQLPRSFLRYGYTTVIDLVPGLWV